MYRQILNKRILHAINKISKNSYCKDKKPPQPPDPISVPGKSVAPKIVAKKPPVEELMKGRIYDDETKSYKTRKPNDMQFEKEKKPPVEEPRKDRIYDETTQNPNKIMQLFEKEKKPPVEEPTKGRIYDETTQNPNKIMQLFEKKEVKPPVKEPTKDRIYDETTQNPNKIMQLFEKKEIKPPAEEPTKGSIYDETTQKPNEIMQLFEKKNIAAAPNTPNTSQDALASVPPPTDTKATATSGNAPPPAILPRVKRQEPGKVFLCLFPAEWVKAFNGRTGVTGFWTLLFTTGTYLVSKEIYVMEHEYYCGLGVVLGCFLGVRYIGPDLVKYVDREIDAIDWHLEQDRVNQKKAFTEATELENSLQLSADGQLVIAQAKREFVDLQLEAEYRTRQMMVYRKVKGLLDYQVHKELIHKKYAQEQMVRWVLDKVRQAITPDVDSQYIDRCLIELEKISQTTVKV